MLLSRMIQHKVDTGADSLFLQSVNHVFKLLCGAEFLIHVQIIRHCVSTVILALSGLQERHKMHISHTQVCQIIDPLFKAGQIV